MALAAVYPDSSCPKGSCENKRGNCSSVLTHATIPQRGPLVHVAQWRHCWVTLSSRCRVWRRLAPNAFAGIKVPTAAICHETMASVCLF